MDFLNQAYAQVVELFQSMTVGARITASLLLTVIVVSLAFLFNHQVSGGNHYLLGGQAFSPTDLNRMQAAFGEAGLSGFEVDGGRIRIPRDEQASYLAALVDGQALPADFGDHFTNALANATSWTSNSQRAEMMKVAKIKELSRLLSDWPGIDRAAVLFDVEDTKSFARHRSGTAAVHVKPEGLRPLEEQRVRGLQEFVAASIGQGLTADSVVIVDTSPGGRTYSGDIHSTGGVLGDRYLAAVTRYQESYEATLRNALSDVHGVTVSAVVELEKELSHHTESTTYDPAQAVPVRTSKIQNSITSQSASPAGRPGLEAQGNSGASLAASGGGNSSEETQKTTESDLLPSQDREVKEMAALTPKMVKYSVIVPSAYFEKIWRQRNPTPEGEEPQTPDEAELQAIEQQETAKIKSAAVALLPPLDPTVDPQSLVTVTSFSSLPMAEIPSTPITEKAMSWFGKSWSTLGMIGLAMFSLLMLRSMIRAGAVATESAGPAVHSIPETDDSDDAEAEPAHERQLKRRASGGPALRDELVDLVREDPDTAASILRNWIGAVN